ncbi:MAG: UDP-N-acetylenolpyruvoylglucosamine reductase [candidate division TA06 bacterium ADurb.Bin417]|uniref:UDP-N-acetylenolpyruvoylglucosamine reductase n=1 Tax=candidate division TA06 bacterium ADurb.Bin417 TaxID=1852828 RepID=A0A1V5MH58_UNCT6|nr:MAG: UDP-N-acetylenolpyruvoylglucosamine reductase [candidate division TA06 bacterium ADurb.Bin417]
MGYVVKYGLGGLEFLAGIPGTLGGALVMNAGVVGREIGSAVRTVNVLDESLAERELAAGAAGFGYRSSSLAGYPLVAGVRLALTPRPPAAIRADIAGQVHRRRLTQPYGIPSAGSVFKNPPGDYAGRLIEAAGCKGWREGDALVSDRHANFIVNTGAASARQVLGLIERVRAAVRSRFGIELELEIKTV